MTASNRGEKLRGSGGNLAAVSSPFTNFQKSVLDEVARGDSEIAAKRLELLSSIESLEVNQAVENLAKQYLCFS